VSDASNDETADRVGVLFALRDEPALVVRAGSLVRERVGRGGTGEVGVRQAGALGGPHRADRARDGDRQRVLADAGRDRAGGRDPRRALGRPRGPRARRRPPGRRRGFHGAGVRAPPPADGRVYRTGPPVPPGRPGGYDGEFFSPSRTAFWGAFAPERASIPIYNGALGPGNVRLTGQFADGWVPNLYPDSQFKEAKGWLADGAARGDRDPASIDVAMYVLTAVDEDPERARRAAAEHIAYYLRDIPGYYDRAAVEAGFEDVVDAVRDAPRRTPARSESRPGSSITSRSSGLPGGAGPTGPPPRDRRRPPDRPGPPGATGVGGARWKRSRRRDESACCRGESVALCCRDEAIAPCRYVEGSEPLALTHRIMRLLVVLALVNMTKRIWEDLLTERDKQVISAAGYDKEGASSWESRGMGTNPMVLVIDMQRLVVGADEPILNAVEEYRTAMGEIAWNAIDHIEPFLEFSRNHEIPVTYTRVVPSSYDDPKPRDLDIVDAVAPKEGETVINKSYASAFYGTDLLAAGPRRPRLGDHRRELHERVRPRDRDRCPAERVQRRVATGVRVRPDRGEPQDRLDGPVDEVRRGARTRRGGVVGGGDRRMTPSEPTEGAR